MKKCLYILTQIAGNKLQVSEQLEWAGQEELEGKGEQKNQSVTSHAKMR